MGAIGAEHTALELMEAVRRLPEPELSRFQREFEAWRRQTPDGGDGPDAETEARLRDQIRENSSLPGLRQKRYEALRRQNEQHPLPAKEHQEYLELLEELELRNVRRIEALIQLASRRGLTLSHMI